MHVTLLTTELIHIPRVLVSLEEGRKVRLDQIFLSAKLLVRGVLDARLVMVVWDRTDPKISYER